MMPVDSIRRGGYSAVNYFADLSKIPFDHASGIGFYFSFIPLLAYPILKKLAIALNPDEYSIEPGKATPKHIDPAKTIKLLTLNVLGFHRKEAEDSSRPYWNERIEAITRVPNESKPDIMGSQETHCGRSFFNAFIERTCNLFSEYTIDILPKALMMGSGVMLADRFVVAKRYAPFEFEVKGGMDGSYVRKGFQVHEYQDQLGEVIMRVAVSHFQSGRGEREVSQSMMEIAQSYVGNKAQGKKLTCAQILDLQARQVIKTMRELDQTEGPARVRILMGDLNANRNCEVEMHPWGEDSWNVLDPSQGEVIDGFYRGDGERSERQLGPNDGTHKSLSNPGKAQAALDNIVAILDEKNGKAGCTLVTKSASSCTEYNSPSDHMALLGEVTLDTV